MVDRLCIVTPHMVSNCKSPVRIEGSFSISRLFPATQSFFPSLDHLSMGPVLLRHCKGLFGRRSGSDASGILLGRTGARWMGGRGHPLGCGLRHRQHHRRADQRAEEERGSKPGVVGHGMEEVWGNNPGASDRERSQLAAHGLHACLLAQPALPMTPSCASANDDRAGLNQKLNTPNNCKVKVYPLSPWNC